MTQRAIAQAIELYRQAVALDPVNPQGPIVACLHLAITGQFAEAQAEYARVMELNPAAPGAHAGLGLAFLLEGKFEEAAVAAQDDAAGVGSTSCRGHGSLESETNSGSRCGAGRVNPRTTPMSAAYQIAEVYAYRGDKDRAFEWLERARRQRDAGLVGLRCDPVYENLHGDPRWDAFLRTLGLADDQLK